MTKHFESDHYSTAHEFLEALRPTNSNWLGDNWRCPWVFRGQEWDQWGLIPSAWRPLIKNDRHYTLIANSDIPSQTASFIASNQSYFDQNNEHLARELLVQRKFEALQIMGFVSLANELGIAVPGGRLPRFNFLAPIEESDPFVEPHYACALAQHHGMPTRLLDWTYNALYAAFFAAEKPDAKHDTIAVWAFNPLHLRPLDEWAILNVPRSQIGYLHAQAGLFLYRRQADDHFIRTGKWPDFISECVSGSLKKLTLPRSEAINLRRLLFAEGVSRVHLMPTLDNIRHTLNTVWLDAEQHGVTDDTSY